MKTAVIYARYSTKNQNPMSIDDQIAYCRDHIEKIGGIKVVSTFFDRALPGEAVKRDGFNNLIDYVLSSESGGKLDYVVAESLDRLSRDPEQTHRMHKIFVYRDVELMSVNEGIIGILHVGLKGTMNSMYKKETADRVRRSHRENAKEGRLPGGNAYGYKVKTDAEDGRGRHIKGVREIIEEQAKVIRRIFEMYADGAGTKAIAQRLNIEDIPSPTGGYWTSSTILGTRSKRSGFLYNDLYRGKLIYNRYEKRHHPTTQKRQSFAKPEKEWIETDVSHLRIVSDELWHRVHARLSRTSQALSQSSQAMKKTSKPSSSNKHLSGVLYCGECGGKYHMANGGRYVCGSYRTHRTCRNARGMRVEPLLEEIFRQLEGYIEETNFLEAFYQVLKEKEQANEEAQKKLSEINDRIRSYQLVIDEGIHLSEILLSLKEIQGEKASVLASLEEHIPHMEDEETIKKKLLKQGLGGLQDGFVQGDFAQSWRAALSLIVDGVFMTPIPDTKRGMTIEVKIAPMEGWAEFYRRITASRAHG